MEFIYEGNSKAAGIYKLTNKLNGRIYYGSTSRFEKRWKEHQYSLKAGKGANKFLQADYNKCGSDAFVFEVLEVTNGTKEERLAIEEKYLEENYDAGIQCYNFMKKAISREAIPSKDPVETSRKMSVSMKASWANSKANGERKVKPETIEKMRQAGKAQWAAKSPDEKELSLPPVHYGPQSPEQIARRVASNRANGTYDRLPKEELLARRRARYARRQIKIKQIVVTN